MMLFQSTKTLAMIALFSIPFHTFGQQDIYKNVEDSEVYELRNVDTDPKISKKLRSVGLQFINSFFKEDFNGMIASSTFPFNWDRAAFIEDEKQYKSYFEERNRQALLKNMDTSEILKTITIIDIQHKKLLIMRSVPVDVYYVFVKYKYKDKNNFIQLIMTYKPEVKVIGFNG